MLPSRSSGGGSRGTKAKAGFGADGQRLDREANLTSDRGTSLHPFHPLTGIQPMARKWTVRKGAQVVELAILLPLLAFLFVIAVDWARIFYYSITVTNCARNGAMYMACQQSARTSSSPYTDSGLVNLYVNSPNPVTAAALADAPNLSPTPTVTTNTGSDTNGAYVEVTVSYTFQTVTGFSVGIFSVPSSTNVTRTCRVYVPPETPN
jgi:Flp pilus assembly protein TadG